MESQDNNRAADVASTVAARLVTKLLPQSRGRVVLFSSLLFVVVGCRQRVKNIASSIELLRLYCS